MTEWQQQFDQVVEQSPAAVVITDLNGTIEYVNKRFTQITGYSAEEAVGQTPRILKSGDVSPEMYRELWETICSAREWRGEFHNRKKSGELYWESALISPLRNTEGVATHYLAIKEDITEHKRMRSELDRAVEQAHRMIHSNILGAVVQEEGVITEVNDSFLALTGYSRDDLVNGNCTLRSITPPEYQAVSEYTQSEVLRTGVSVPVEKQYRRKDGSTVPVLVAGALLASEPLPKWVYFVLDLTERKTSEDALIQSEAKYRRIVETAAEGIIEVDAEARIMFANSAMASMLGCPAKELQGNPISCFVDPEHMADLRKRFEELRERKRNYLELKVRRCDGGSGWMGVSVSPIHGADGAIAGALALVSDLTARKEIEEQLARRNAQLRGLTAELLRSEDHSRRCMARELHDSTAQLLTAISMNLDQVRDFLPAGSSPRALLDETIAFARQCTTEIRAISYCLHPPLLDELGLGTAVQVFGEGFQQRSGVRLDVSVSPGFERLNPDVELALFRIIQESVANVQRHSGSPMASIRLEQDSNGVRLEIKDQGRGMPAAIHNGNGQGVGLLGMRERAEHLGGRFEVVSSSQGTTIVVTLPKDATQ
jgi:PAS domain S-box-containing protein